MRLGFVLWLGLGNLNNGGNDGLCYVNANNTLGNANWNIGSRTSDYLSRVIKSNSCAVRLTATNGDNTPCLTKRNWLMSCGLVAIANTHSPNQRGTNEILL